MSSVNLDLSKCECCSDADAFCLNPSIDFGSLAQKSTYIAWVPVVMGKLNFSRFSPQLITENLPKKDRADSVAFKQKTQKERRILVSSVYDWKDQDAENVDGQFRVVISASVKDSKNEKYLDGSIYIYPHEFSGRSVEGNCKEGSRNKVEDFIENFTNKISDLETLNGKLEHYNLDKYYKDSNQHETYDCVSDADTLLDDIEKYMSALSETEHECYQVRFITKKNGLTFLNFDRNGKSYDELTTHIVSRQAFYYLKYALHTHKHHPHQEDSITTIHSLKDDSRSAAILMLDELQRSIVDIKAFLHENRATNHQVEGITSYCKALVEILYKENVLTRKQREHRMFLLSNYIKSAKAVNKVIATNKKTGLSIGEQKTRVYSSLKQNIGLVIALASLFSIFVINAYAGKPIQIGPLDVKAEDLVVLKDCLFVFYSFLLLGAIYLCLHAFFFGSF